MILNLLVEGREEDRPSHHHANHMNDGYTCSYMNNRFSCILSEVYMYVCMFYTR